MYRDSIIKAHARYMKSIERNNIGIENLYGREYENRMRNINRASAMFESVCKLEGLNYIVVNSDLIPNTIKIS